MQKLKRFFALLVAVMTIITSIPSMAFAEDVNENPDVDDGNEPTQQEIVIADEAYQTFQVKWNDNHNENNKKARPTEADFSAGATLVFTLDGKEYELSEETMGLIGLTELPEIEFKEGELSEWDYKPLLPKTINVWTEVEVIDPEGDESEADEPKTEWKYIPHDVSWNIEYTVDEVNYLTKVTEEKPESHKVMFTLTSGFTATVEWLDNENLYKSRPALDYVLHRHDAHNKTEAVEDAANHVDIDKETVPSDWKYALKGLPAYDDIGDPYIYSFDFGRADIEAESDAGHYGVLYENTDNHEEQVDELYIDGKCVLTLKDDTCVTINKVWIDNENKNRPDCTLYLYRVAEDVATAEDGHKYGTTTAEKMEHAGPVQHFDNAPVPEVNEEGAPIPDNTPTPIYFGKTTDQEENIVLELPKYDLSGKKYIYFTTERYAAGQQGDYQTEIDNSAADYSDTIKEIANDKDNNYVLNGATITNIRKGEIKTQATKIFTAKSMQQGDVSVKFALQIYDKEAGAWRDATKADLSADHEPGSDVTADDNHVYLEMNDFSAEVRGKTVDGPYIKKYDSDGDTIKYRWYEAAVRVGNNWVDCTPQDTSVATGQIEYAEQNAGDVAPGVEDSETGEVKYTTARFTVTQEDETTVENKLIGETQIKITKIWHNAEGKPFDPEGESAVFDIYRNGEIYDKVTMSVEDRVETGKWVLTYEGKDGSTHLPRYDEQGREYEYKAEEEPTDNWSAEFTVKKDVVTDRDGYKVTELQYEYVNGVGEGGIEIDVEKAWLDDSDLMTRVPVTVQVFRVDYDKKELKPVPKATATIGVDDDWYVKFGFNPLEKGDTQDDYVVLETAINGAEVNYKDNVVDILKEYQDKDPKAANYPDEWIAGECDEGDPRKNVDYAYDVFVSRPSHENEYLQGGGFKYKATYAITNRRKGLLNLELTKTWAAGGGDVPTAGFVVTRSTEDTQAQKVGEFALPDAQHEYIEGFEDYRITGSDNKYTINLNNLPKYDSFGRQYTYSIKEVWLSDETNKFKDNKAQVGVDTYTSKTYESDKDIKGREYHHSGDKYIWAASNVREGSYELNSYKVWRDDGTAKNLTARPDVYFDVYRVAVTDEKFEALMSASSAIGKNLAVEAFCKSALAKFKAGDTGEGVAEKYKADKKWNTKNNDWCWDCDLGTVPRYDKSGKRYIYFVKEGYSGDSGEYVDYYLNDSIDSIVGTPKEYLPSESPDVQSTVDVLSTSIDDDAFTTDVAVLADGVNGYNHDEKYGDYYSRTVVNTREHTRTIHGQKIWELPPGFKILDKDLPSITINCYRSIVELTSDITSDYEKMKEAIAQYNMTYIGKRELGNGNWTFAFDTYKKDGRDAPIEKYDDYGRTYHYYLLEHNDLDQELKEYDYKVEDLAHTYFHVRNTYVGGDEKVKINVTKEWKSSVDGYDVDDMAPAVFELYAVICDKNGNRVKNSSGKDMDPVKLATKTIQPGTTSFAFDKVTEKISYIEGTDIPLKGPNQEDMKFYVVEKSLNGTKHTHDSEGWDEAKNAIYPELGEGATLYTSDLECVNDYEGDTKDITVHKAWDKTSSYDNAKYIPAKITFKIYRAATTAVTVNGKSYPVEPEAFIENVVLTKDDKVGSETWSKKLTGLRKYAPSGQEYKYYVKEEIWEYNKDSQNFTESTSDKTEKNNKISHKNTLKTTSITAKKDWAWANYKAGTKFTAAEFNELVALGVLPESVKFTVQRKTANTDYSDVTYVNSSGTTVTLSHTVKTKDALSFTGKTWSDLPQNDIDGNAYTYRIKEEFGSITIYSKGTDAEKSADTYTGTGKVKDKATVTESGTTATFKNEIYMHEFALRKQWDDNHNRDNTRPDELKITLQLPAMEGQTEGAKTVFTLMKTRDQQGDLWVLASPKLYLPEVADADYKTAFNSLLSEAVPEGYVQDGVDWSNGVEGSTTTTITFKNKWIPDEPHTRVLLDLSIIKNFLNDRGADNLDWAKLRPIIKISLEYLQQGVDVDDATEADWIAVTESNKSVVGIADEEPVVQSIILDATDEKTNSGSVAWDGLYKYWDRDDEEEYGTPEPISYRISEKCYVLDEDGEEVELPLDSYKTYTPDNKQVIIKGKVDPVVDEDGNVVVDFSEEAEFNNTLDTVTIDAEKKWTNDEINSGELRIPIVMTLYQNNISISKKTADSDNSWYVKWEKLPKYDKNGDAYTYKVVESPAPGYTGTVVENPDRTFTWTNDFKPGTIEFNKVLLANETCSENESIPADGTKLFKDVTFGLFKKNKDGGYDKYDEATSDADGNVKFDPVPNGSYYVQELAAPAPSILDDTKYYVDMVPITGDTDDELAGKCVSTGLFLDEELTEELSEQTIINDQLRTDISLVKVDENDVERLIPGATYALYRVKSEEMPPEIEQMSLEPDADETPEEPATELIEVARKTTDASGSLTFEGLITGTDYIIKEVEAAKGTYLSDDTVSFSVVDKDGKAEIVDFKSEEGAAEFDGETLRITWADPIVVAEILKVNEYNEPLAGAKLQIIDKSDKSVVETWKSTEDPHELYAKLETGKKYILHEVKAPKGYDLAKDVEFVVPATAYKPGTAETIVVTMVDKETPEEPDTGDSGNLPLLMTIFGAAVASLAGMLRMRRRRA